MFVHKIWRRFFTFPLLAILLPVFSLSACPRLVAEDRGRALMKSQAPVYPELARQMRIEGTIVLVISILPDGHVRVVRVNSGHLMLAPAAEAAVREWRYAAASATTEAVVTVGFHLH